MLPLVSAVFLPRHAPVGRSQASVTRTPVQGRVLRGESTAIGISTSPPRCAFAVSRESSGAALEEKLNEQQVKAMLRPPQRRSPRISSRTSVLLLSLLFALSFLAQPCQSLPEVRGNFRAIIQSDTLACSHTLVSLAPLLRSVCCDPRSQRLTARLIARRSSASRPLSLRMACPPPPLSSTLSPKS